MPEAWKKDTPPKRILAIRLQAMGDVIITLPYLQALRNALPETTTLDFLTREEVAGIPRSLHLFDHVYTIGGGRNFKLQCLSASLLLPRLLYNRYDVVIDLQHNILSDLLRKIIHPEAWAEFDRFSPISAGERNLQTIESAGLGNIVPDFHLTIKSVEGVEELLIENGWNKEADLIILNPAGAFENRNWPIDQYIKFAQLWLQDYPQSQFLILGVDKVIAKATVLKSALNGHLIDLVNKTNPAQAFTLVQKAKLVLSEDSGLMHMAWISGIPTIALFGSTRSDWSRPLGAHTFFLDSSDMVCGNCMLEQCRYNDDRKNSCMTRYTAFFVYEQAKKLLHPTSTIPSSK